MNLQRSQNRESNFTLLGVTSDLKYIFWYYRQYLLRRIISNDFQLKYLLLILTFTSVLSASGNTITSFQGGNWNSGSTWIGNVAPVAGDNVIINHNIIVTANASITDMTISLGVNSLTINPGIIFTVNGTFILNGPCGVIGLSTTSKLILNGDFKIPSGQTPYFDNINVTQIVGKNFTIDGTFAPNYSTSPGSYAVSIGELIISSTGTWSQGAPQFNANSLTITDGGTIDNAGSNTGTLNITNNFTVNSGTFGNVSTIGNGRLLIGGSTTINGTLYLSRTGSGSKSFAGTTGTITVNHGGEFRNLVGEDIFMDCNIINNGTWPAPTNNNGKYTVSTGPFTYSGANTIGMASISMIGAASVTNNGKLSLTNTSTIALTVCSSCAFTNGAGSYLQIYTPFANPIFNSGGTSGVDFHTYSNEVDYAYPGNQNVFGISPGTVVYNKLTLSNSGTKSCQGNIQIDNTLTTSGSAILYDNNGNHITGTAGITMSGTSQIRYNIISVTVPELTFTSSSNSIGSNTTIQLSPTGNNTVTLKPNSRFQYENVLVNGSGSADVGSVTKINGNITITGNSRISNNQVMTVGGTLTYSSSATSVLANNVTVGSLLIPSATTGVLNVNLKDITVNGVGGSWANNAVAGSITNNTGNTVTFTSGTGQQIGGSVPTTFYNLTINNPNHVTLASSPTVSNQLNFISGNIITTSSYNMILASTGNITRTASTTDCFVDGNFQKYYNSCTACTFTFEVGSGSGTSNPVYAPHALSGITTTSTGYFISSTTGTIYPLISTSLIDPNRCVNRYWSLYNSGIIVSGPGYKSVFTYSSTDITYSSPDPLKLYSERYDPSTSSWNNGGNPIAPNPAATLTSFTVGTVTTVPNSGTGATPSRDYIIGEPIAAAVGTITNRAIGTASWGNAATWMKLKTGSISVTLGSTVVTGGGTTKFLTEIKNGDVLVDYTIGSGAIIGTVSSISDDNNLTLTANASVTYSNVSYAIETIPTSTDAVSIGLRMSAATDIQIDASSPSYKCYSLTFVANGSNQSVTHTSTNPLTVSGSVSILHPSADGFTNSWNINGGSATASAITIGNASTSNARIAKILLTAGGTLTVSTPTFNASSTSGSEVTTVLDNSGEVKVSGTISFSTNLKGTLTGTGIINYKGNSSQTVAFPSNSLSSWIYGSIYSNNTSSGGLLLSADLTTTNFKGDLKIQSGSFSSSGAYNITGSGSKTFQISPGATFTVGNSLTGFGTYDLGTSSPFGNFIYSGYLTSPYSLTYGNVQFISSNTFTLPTGTFSVKGSLTTSGGAALASPGAGSGDLSIENDLILGTSSNIYNVGGTIGNISIGGNWTNNSSFINVNPAVIFTGLGQTQPQLVSGSTSELFSNVTVNTSTTGNIVRLAKSMTLNSTNTLTLTQGGLELNGNTLYITNANTNAISRSSGYIKSEKQTSPYSPIVWTTNAQTGLYIFPFGISASEYIPLKFNTVGGSNFGSTLSVATYGTGVNNLPLPSGVANVTVNGNDNTGNSVVDRFWIITPNYASLPTATITFTAASTEATGITSPKAQRWNVDHWDPRLPGLTGGNPSIASGVNQFGVWTLSDVGAPLPIQLEEFKALVTSSYVKLSWRTLSEINNDHFTIERSTKGLTFEEIGEVRGNGTTSDSHNYELIDFSTPTGKVYYRLKQVDFDAKSTYSEVVAVNSTGINEISIAPNPVVGISKVLVPANLEDESIKVEIYNLEGVLVSHSDFLKVSTLNIDRGDFLSGVYFLLLITSTKSYTLKFMISGN